jgi:hypothetical protein
MHIFIKNLLAKDLKTRLKTKPEINAPLDLSFLQTYLVIEDDA